MKKEPTTMIVSIFLCFIISLFLSSQVMRTEYMVTYGEIENQYIKPGYDIIVIEVKYEYLEFRTWREGITDAEYHDYMMGDYVKVEYTVNGIGNLHLINIQKVDIEKESHES